MGTFLNFANSISLFTIILPFVIVFGITYGILSKIKLFNNRINGMIAVVIGLMALTVNFDSLCVASLFKLLAIALITGLVTYIVIGFMSPNHKEKYISYIVLGVMAIVLIAYGISSNTCNINSLSFSVGNYVVWWILGVTAFIIVIWWIIRGTPITSEKREEPKKETHEEKHESEKTKSSKEESK